ncbi:MAG: hypothetical protein V1723_02000 [Candidatus Uhrbacteria bacterium]
MSIAIRIASAARRNRTQTADASGNSVRDSTDVAARTAVIHVRARADLAAVRRTAIAVHVPGVARNPA